MGKAERDPKGKRCMKAETPVPSQRLSNDRNWGNATDAKRKLEEEKLDTGER